MCIRENSWAKETERKHPRAFFAVYFTVSILVILIGVCLLAVGVQDISVPIIMIVLGALGAVCTILLKRGKN